MDKLIEIAKANRHLGNRDLADLLMEHGADGFTAREIA
jgi:hypothetical protein